jgi:hypothetical protein
MPAECPSCENQVEPVSAPVVDGAMDTDHQISVYELDNFEATETEYAGGLTDIVFLCPVCRYVFETQTPDSSWLWVDWSGIPVVVDETLPATLANY